MRFVICLAAAIGFISLIDVTSEYFHFVLDWKAVAVGLLFTHWFKNDVYATWPAVIGIILLFVGYTYCSPVY